MRPVNPFSPSFGISPPVLAGRREVLRSFDSVFDNVRSPSYATLLWGLRGTGKTVLLNAFEDRARAEGWMVVSAAAVGREGLVGQIRSKASALLHSVRSMQEAPSRRAVTGVSVMGTGIQFEPASAAERAEAEEAGLETVLATLGESLVEQGTGLLVTIDELHVSETDEIREFGSVFQLASRRAERPVAFVGAALPELEDRLMAGDASTFLQRCRRHEIANLRPSEAAIALREPIEEAGGRIDDDALEIAVDASMGQPYLVQLIGSYLWDDAEDLARGATAHEARRAVADATVQFGRHVHGPVWNRLSDLDKRFLVAMLADAGTSAIADIGRRWGHSPHSLSTYRRRLLSAGLISSVGRGRAAFSDSTVREYVEARAAAEGFIPDG